MDAYNRIIAFSLNTHQVKSSSLVRQELAKRQAQKAPMFCDGHYILQDDFIANPARFKAFFATRRCGKTYTGGLYMCKEAYETAGCSVLYVGLTKESARRTLIKDVLRPINRRFKLNIKFNATTLTCTFPNGSIIYIMGLDSSEDEKEKALGQKYKLAIIDEAASYSIDLRELVYGVLKPAMADLRGTIVLLGTPGNLTKSLFYDVTTGVEPGWHVVKANTFQNPYMAEKWKQEIDELTAQQPYIVETPMFKQMYLGEWVIDTDALVYKFSAERNIYETLPLQASGDWQHVLGVDLGYEDASAFVVCVFHEHDKVLYIVDTYSKKHMDITDVATKIKELKLKYNIYKVVIDNANKQAVEEMQKRHSLPLIPADKTGKSDFIEIMNAELIQGYVKVQINDGKKLVEEWQNLVWKEKGLKREENPACDNHLADACLYAWRFCYNYIGERPKQKPQYGTKAWSDAETDRMEEEALEYFTKQEEAIDPYSDI